MKVDNKYKIIIVSDEDSWINRYISKFVEELIKNGHNVIHKHHFDIKNKYDFAFLLSFSKIVSGSMLQLNKHNLVVHESALPKGKGWSPLTWQILNGERKCPITLFEATDNVDSGKIYLQRVMEFNGNELIDNLRKIQAENTIEMCLEFVHNYENVMNNAREQDGESTYYQRRTQKDSELNIEKTIKEQFNLLRVVDNEKYPAHFYIRGEKYILKIYKE